MSYIPTEDGLTAMLTSALPGWQLQPWALRDTSDNTTKICAYYRISGGAGYVAVEDSTWMVELRASRDDTLGNAGMKVAVDAIIQATRTLPSTGPRLVDVQVINSHVGGFADDGRYKATLELRVLNNLPC